MTPEVTDSLAERVNAAWKNRDDVILRCAAAVMACAALLWLGYEFWRFFLTPNYLFGRKILFGGVDLKLLHGFVGEWFSGVPVYRLSSLAVYPPASHVLAWPLVGWTGFAASRLLWTAVTVPSLAFLAYCFVRHCGCASATGRLFAGLIPLATYPAGAVIGNGQMTIIVLSALTASLMLLTRPETGWKTDILASILFLAALLKPHISAPFFWMALFLPGRVRPALLIAGGYCVLTLFAASLQDAPLFILLSDWLSRGAKVAAFAGYSNIHLSLALFGLGKYGLLSSLLLLAALGFLIFRCRRADFWVLMGITAVTARLWTYHQWFDDLLIALPIIALLRTAGSLTLSAASRVTSGALAGSCVLLMLAPGGHFVLPPPWKGVYIALLTLVWAATLAFLAGLAWKQRERAGEVPARPMPALSGRKGME